MRLSAAQKEEIRAAHKAGASKRSLARKYGVSENTVWRILNPTAFAALQVKFWSMRLEGERER